jgi:hypothetical protein
LLTPFSPTFRELVPVFIMLVLGFGVQRRERGRRRRTIANRIPRACPWFVSRGRALADARATDLGHRLFSSVARP